MLTSAKTRCQTNVEKHPLVSMHVVFTTVPVGMDMNWTKVALNLNVKVSFLYLLQNKCYL